MLHFEQILLLGAVLILVSIFLSKLLENIGIPTLLLFIGVGMIAGSDVSGGIRFNSFGTTQAVGITALVFILFSGGLDTNWDYTKNSFFPALSLATVGVLVTTAVVGFFVHLITGTSLLWGLLFGAVISSTDAAAVFSILRLNKIALKGKLKPLIELESGSNDPMAVFLTISLIELILKPASSVWSILLLFVAEMSIGAVLGLLLGKAMVLLNNKLRFNYEGIYPVFALSFCLLIYALTSYIGGSGFLAVYIAGIVAGNSHYVQKKVLLRFFDGMAFLSQVVMFLTLGLLVNPSELFRFYASGLIIVAVLIFLARPIAVFISLIPFRFHIKEKIFLSWVGLRGAVPVILAIFPMLAGVPGARVIFNLVFFIVITSVLVQGWSVKKVAEWLGVADVEESKRKLPLEFNPVDESSTELIEMIVPFGSPSKDKEIVDLNFPSDSRIVLIYREDQSIIPDGRTIIQEGDVLMILVKRENVNNIRSIF